MSGLRNNFPLTSLALIALALQFVVGFGHLHSASGIARDPDQSLQNSFHNHIGHSHFASDDHHREQRIPPRSHPDSAHSQHAWFGELKHVVEHNFAITEYAVAEKENHEHPTPTNPDQHDEVCVGCLLTLLSGSFVLSSSSEIAVAVIVFFIALILPQISICRTQWMSGANQARAPPHKMIA